MTKKLKLPIGILTVLAVFLAALLFLPLGAADGFVITASAEVWSGQSADSFATGDGTEANPYQIKTAEELAFMASKVNSGEANYPSAHYKLTADIVLNESLDGTPHEWTAIGTDTAPFTGKFDGNGHTISGIVIKSTDDYQGLFGYSSGTIMNVGVINSCIWGVSNVGGVCGYNNGGTIEDCYNTGTVSGMGNSVGGVCGQNQGGTIENCYSTGEVRGINEVGGVCGYNYSNSTIKNCYSTGAVNSTGGNNVGGVCGQNQGGTIENCYSTGKVIGTNIVGGVCGYNSSNSTITNCYSTGAVSAATNKVGGVCGQNNGTITNCYYNADFYTGSAYGGGTGTANNVTSKTTTAALCSSLPTGFEESVWTTGSYTADGKKATATFPQLKVFESTSAPTTTLSLYNFGTEEAPKWDTYTEISTAEELQNIKNNLRCNYVLTTNITLTAPTEGESNWTAIGTKSAPFTGKFDGNGHTISGIVIKSTDDYQGLFGYSSGTIMNVGVINSFISGGSNVGGVCGKNLNGTITNCYSTGTVSGTGEKVGGVCGDNTGSIKNCYSIGAVSGSFNVGGVCGHNTGSIENCYSTGAVSGTGGYVGGICGDNYGDNYCPTIKNCYSTGTVSGREYVGGVCGYNTYGTIENCYSTGAVSAAGDYVGGVCGYNYSNSTIKNCYYDTDFYTGNAIGNNQGTATNVTGKTTAELCGSTLPAGFEESVWTTGSYTADGKKATATLPQLNVFANTSAPTTTLSLYNLGTEEAPKWDAYTEISTAEELQNIKNNLRCNYILTTNITLTAPTEGESNWTAIGTDTAPFTGKFDGNGHTISGIVINKYDKFFQGLFGYSTGTIMNVGVIDSSISGSRHVGGVCGYNDRGTIENCYNTGAVNGRYAGGVCGDNMNGTIENCYNTGAVNGGESVGGVCGDNMNGTIKNCYNTGAVNGGSYAGGVCGYNDRSTIENCYSTGGVSGSNNVGGVCGENAEGTIENCYSTGAVSGNNYVGGVCGCNSNSIIANCYYLAETETDSFDGTTAKISAKFTGGEVAYLLSQGTDGSVWGQTIGTDDYPVLGGATVYKCTKGCTAKYANTENATGEHTAPDTYDNGFGKCTDCAADVYQPATSIDGVYQIGNAGQLYWFAGLVNGTLENVAQKKSANAVLTVDITVNSNLLNSLSADGTVPEGTTVTSWTPISNYYTGTFDGQGHTISGLYFNDPETRDVGLFGNVEYGGKVSNVGVKDSYFKGIDFVGGVCGDNSGSITNCYNTGEVSATGQSAYVGGVCGRIYNGTITNCYNTGEVSATGQSACVGGVYGRNYYGTITNCYNTGEVSATGVSAYVGGVCGWFYNGTIANCYFDSTVYSGNAVGLINDGTVSDNVLGKATAKFTGGEVAYLLQSGQTEDENGIIPEVWGQDLRTTTNYPVLGGAPVYKCTNGCTGKYSNEQYATGKHTAPDTYDNGFGKCTDCNVELYQPATLNNGVYEIGNAGQLYWFSQQVNSGKTGINAILTDNITVNTGGVAGCNGYKPDEWKDWTPIVDYTGTFDGNNKTISGLYFNKTDANSVGLFGRISTGGTVKNVGVVDSYFSGSTGVGGVCGGNEGAIENCYNTGTVSGVVEASYVGGVCGRNEGTIENCYNTGIVSGAQYFGGVCGGNEGNEGKILNCYNTGVVTSSVDNANYAGGVCGINNGGTIANCYYFAESETDSFDGTTAKSATQFGSGEVAYLLQGAQTTAVWGQTLRGETPDAYPVLGGAKVYQTLGCVGYSNTANETKAHKDENEDGTCDLCNAKFAYIVSLHTVANEGTPSVANPSGGGKFNAGETTTITAEALPGYTFNGWFKGDEATAYCTDLSFEYTPTADVSFTAKYTANRTMSVTVTSESASFNVAVNNGTSENFTTQQVISYAVGTVLTLTANGDNFDYWANDIGAVVSRNPSFDYTVVGNVSLTAVFKTKADNKATVTFVTAYDQIIGRKQITAADTIDVPVTPVRYGYDFVGWSVNGGDAVTVEKVVAEIQKAVGEVLKTEGTADDVVMVRPVYNAKEISIKVTVYNGNDETGTELSYNVNEIVTVTAEAVSGKKFAYWTDGAGKTLSYNEKYSFYATISTTVKAVYVDEETVVEAKGTTEIVEIIPNSATGKISFVSLSAVPEGCTIQLAGLIATTNAEIANGEFNDTTAEYVRGLPFNGTSYRFTWNKTVQVGLTWYVKAYLVYTDKNGNTQTIYGDTVRSATLS